jgi:hypothetical protein
MPRRRIYQAMLARPDSLERVRAAQRLIARAGGQVEMLPTGSPGLTTVLLHLPEPLQPEEFLPGIPFYPT